MENHKTRTRATASGQSVPPRHPRRVSRTDIAALANVSTATVTYALNPSPNSRISKATSNRIRRLAEELGYRPAFVHKAMSAGRTFAIGLILPQSKSLLFPFYELMHEGLLKAMNEDDYDPLFLMRSRWDRVEKVVRQGRVDGLVLVQSDLDDRYIRKAAALDIPLVVMNRDLPFGLEGDRVACVFSDHDLFMQEAVQELVVLGCKRLLYFSNATATFADHMNTLAFEAQLQRHGESGVTGQTIEPVWDSSSPHVDHVFEGNVHWDGIIVNGGAIAQQLVNVAEAKGLHPGRDYQLITRDAFPDTYGYRHPPLDRRERAVFLQQPLKVGSAAWSLMDALLGGQSPPDTVIRVPYERIAIPY